VFQLCELPVDDGEPCVRWRVVASESSEVGDADAQSGDGLGVGSRSLEHVLCLVQRP